MTNLDFLYFLIAAVDVLAFFALSAYSAVKFYDYTQHHVRRGIAVKCALRPLFVYGVLLWLQFSVLPDMALRVLGF